MATGELFAFSTQAAARSHPRMMKSNSVADVGGLGHIRLSIPSGGPQKKRQWDGSLQGILGGDFFFSILFSFLLKQCNK